MSETRLALSRELPPAMKQGLEQFGTTVVCGDDTKAMEGCRIYVCTGLDSISPGTIESMPESIELIANIGVGIDHIDLAAAAGRNIQVCNTPAVTEDTADLTFALILAASRRLSLNERLLRQGQWLATQQLVGTRVHGKVLGIVGFGAIGQAVAQRAQGFGMRVLYHGPNRKLAAEQQVASTYRESLEHLLAESDIVALTCPLTPDTHHLINTQSLRQMKQGAVLVNTGRGPLIDESALVQNLREGHLAAAGLDVFEFEPEVSQGLLELDGVTVLPHIGSATSECRVDMALSVFANIESFLQSGMAIDLCTAG